jgi:hypothetical protein
VAFEMTALRDARALLVTMQTAHARHLGGVGSGTPYSKLDPRTASRHAEGPLHAVADAHLAQLKRAVLAAMKASRAVIDQPMLQKAIATDDQQLAETAVMAVSSAFKAKLKKLLPPILKATLIAGGQVGATLLSDKLRVASRWCKITKIGDQQVNTHRAMTGSDLCRHHGGMRGAAKPPDKFEFDPEDELVQAWIDEHAAELADQLSNTTEEDVAAALQDAFDAGELGDLEATIVAIAEDADRSAMIAMNEVMTAVSEGQRQAWTQAANDGYLTGNEVRQWNTADADACPECDDLDGETTEMDGEYPGGALMPLHPWCRCFETLVEASPRTAGGVGSGITGHTTDHSDAKNFRYPNGKTVLEGYVLEGAFMYEGVNGMLREGDKTVESRPEVKALEAEMVKSSKEMTLYRVLEGSSIPANSVGDKFVDKGFVSTSLSRASLSGIADAIDLDRFVTMKIEVPQGIKMVNVNQVMGHNHKYADQKEVVLTRGLKYQVTKITDAEVTVRVL